MTKASRRKKRIMRLYETKRYKFDYYLSSTEKVKIDEWCTENLNDRFVWRIGEPGHYGFPDTYEIRFQSETDLMAFMLRWI